MILLVTQLEGGEKDAPPHLKCCPLAMKLLSVVVPNASHFYLTVLLAMMTLSLVVPAPNALHLEILFATMTSQLLVGVVLKMLVYLETLLAMMRLLLLVEVVV